jgi:transposase-like protein
MSEDPELSLNAAVHRIGPRVGVVPDTLRGWMKQARIDAGLTAGTTTTDAKRIKDLEREVRELKRANEILLAASSFFARELDPRLLWLWRSSTTHPADRRSQPRTCITRDPPVKGALLGSPATGLSLYCARSDTANDMSGVVR